MLNCLLDLLLVVLTALLLGLGVSCLFGVQYRAVLSGSMEPYLPVGSLVAIQPAGLDELQVGDDVSYVRDESLAVVTHRIIAIDRQTGYVTTQGTANNTPDAPVWSRNIIGKVLFCVPLLGYPVLFLSNPHGKLAAVCGIFSLLILSFIADGRQTSLAIRKEENTQ